MDQPVSYHDRPLWVAPMYIYDVELYYMSPKKFYLLSSKRYTSDKLLNTLDFEIVKRFKKFYIGRYINLIGAPISFIRENNFPLYKFKERKKHEKRTRNDSM